jgi:hypothetical protein
VSGLEFTHVAQRARGRRHVAQLEVGVERVPIELAGREPRGYQGLELGRERDSPGPPGDVERLYPQAVAREQQALGRGIPDRKGEHAAQLRDAVRAELLVEVEDGLGVAVGAQHVPAGYEPAAQLLVVVDLAVEDDRFGAVFVEDRLLAPGQVDDTEPSHSETHAPPHPDALVVRAAVLQGGAHPAHERLRDGALSLAIDQTSDAAHGLNPAQE